jgi:hypothetical protein
MTEISTWIQSNWYEFGSILAQIAFLVAGVWFARKILKTLRASQEQFGALLKLTLTDELAERAKANAAAQRPTASVEADRPTPYVMAEWPTAPAPAPETPALTLPGGQRPHNPLVAACRGIVRWLKAPIRRPGPSPLRKVARWLQAPARS